MTASDRSRSSDISTFNHRFRRLIGTTLGTRLF